MTGMAERASSDQVSDGLVSDGLVSGEVAGTAGSGIRAVANAAWSVPGALRLDLGEPDFPTPARVVAAAHAAATAGHTGYGPSAGLPALRAAIAGKLARDNGLPDVGTEQITVTAGGVGGLFAAYRMLLSAGDQILVPDPGWPNFAGLATLLGAVPLGYPLDPAANFEPDYDRLDSLAGLRTRAILINSPANPVGFQWTPTQLARLGEWAARRGLTVISDECYDQLWLDQPTTTFSVAAPGVPAVTVFSLSKSYAMTGWRVGYTVTDRPELAAGLTRVQEIAASCVNTVAQHAAIAALSGPQDDVHRMRQEYRRRREVAVETARGLGLDVVVPAGAFYLWLTIPGADTTARALDLLRSRCVAVAPGRAFGPAGAGHLRLSLAAPLEHIARGLSELAGYLREQQLSASI